MTTFLEFLSSISWWLWIIIVLAIIAIRDILQKKHTIQNNFPLIGHIRYLFESIGPEIRQYFVANNREELPFNRIERSWIYASAKQENNYEGFGTDRDIYAPGENIWFKAYILNANDGNGCTVSDSLEIFINETPIANINNEHPVLLLTVLDYFLFITWL